MEETLEMITWSQLGIHKKPVISKSSRLKCNDHAFVHEL